MREASFELRVKSGTWGPEEAPADPERTPGFTAAPLRMTGFTLTASRNGVALGGHNVQAHVYAPGHMPGADDDADRPDMTLTSGWGVWFRNDFARAPDIAAQIVGTVDAELSRVTAELGHATAAETRPVSERVLAMAFRATGPDYWA